MMARSDYERKRDFSKTPEPRAAGAGPGGRTYVVQKHDASRLHYDLRLQVGDALASWAVPKGPSRDPSHKRLAVHVEDHPVEYADFEGVIPQGQYGGGTVMLWDEGEWAPEDADPARALERGRLSFTLNGKRLRGRWTLTRIRATRAGDSGDNWLLIKSRDDEARPGEPLPDDDNRSVRTGRTMAQIAAADESAPARAPAEPLDPASVDGARRAPLPRAISPQLCTLADAAPEGDAWIHEIKFDGYRLLWRRNGERGSLLTRTGKDWTDRFAPLRDALLELPGRRTVIDGEAAILDEHGRTSFQRLQNAIRERSASSVVYFVFDLLHLDGYDLTRVPLLERKRLLRSLVPDAPQGVVRYSDHVQGGGPSVRANACELALEGIISKRADARYAQSRSRTWLKVKCSRRQEFVVIGWSPPSGSRKHFGALLLGAYDADGRLAYTGRVGAGFNARSLRDIRARLDRIERRTTPADEPPTPGESRGVRWVTPELVAEVEFTEWTDDGRLRHPSFQGLREDKDAKRVRVERAAPIDEIPEAERSNGRRRSTMTPARTKASRAHAEVLGVRLSNPDRVLYPDQGATKLDLARYYEAVAERMLPFIAARPVSTVRCPQGRAGQCFFQKHLRETFSDPVRAIRVKEEAGPADYIAIDSADGLVALVQFGVLEIHPWGSREGSLDAPDLLTFDLDPGEGAAFQLVRDGAQRIRRELESMNMAAFLKTTGGKGLHVVTPIEPDIEWEAARAFCADLARGLASEEPSRYVATVSKAKRRGRVFIDYLRNSRGATSIAPFSTRARPGAPVAMPLRWDELAALDQPDRYTIANALRRLGALRRDPWEAFDDSRASIRAIV